MSVCRLVVSLPFLFVGWIGLLIGGEDAVELILAAYRDKRVEGLIRKKER